MGAVSLVLAGYFVFVKFIKKPKVSPTQTQNLNDDQLNDDQLKNDQLKNDQSKNDQLNNGQNESSV